MERSQGIMEAYSSKDYYNENGTLLLAKGVPINFKMLKKLQQYKAVDFADVTLDCEPGKMKCEEQANKLRERFQGANEQTLNQVSDILIKMVFESKQSPWWMFVNALSNYIDWLYTHSIDVAMISLMIAVELQYSEKTLREIGLGALLHDVGKLLIPKRILQKIEPLTEGEKLILRQHCELGMDSITGCSLPKISTNIILQHHERLDGSGYPNELNGGQISEYAKIVMIADAFDAITAGRPYKKAKGSEGALSILKNQNEKYSKEYLRVLDSLLK